MLGTILEATQEPIGSQVDEKEGIANEADQRVDQVINEAPAEDQRSTNEDKADPGVVRGIGLTRAKDHPKDGRLRNDRDVVTHRGEIFRLPQIEPRNKSDGKEANGDDTGEGNLPSEKGINENIEYATQEGED